MKGAEQRRTSKCGSFYKLDRSTVTKLKCIRHNYANKESIKISSSYGIYNSGIYSGSHLLLFGKQQSFEISYESFFLF